jgi:hypothetical protein
MSNVNPTTPSFVFGYWRPWKENSNVFDSYLDYSRDKSLVRYGADTVGKYIKMASKEQVIAINQLGQAIGRGMNVLSNQMTDINDTLVFLNRNIDVQIEQHKLSNLLLQNISELLRIPDIEKERQHSIELGVKFFVNAQKDSDLYADALEELLKAESLMKQDYFVLHRIGCIYLYVEKFINPEKALDYFLRAAKYASVENDSSAVKLANILTSSFDNVNTDIINSEKQIGLLASDSFEKASFTAYILGKFEDAEAFQKKALKLNDIAQNKFLLSKYQIRNNKINEALENLESCINEEPFYAIATFKEIDLINEPAVINLIEVKNEEINAKIKDLIKKWDSIKSIESNKIINDLNELLNKSYEIKINNFREYESKSEKTNDNIAKIKTRINPLIRKIKDTRFTTFDNEKIATIINELEQAKDFPIEKMQKTIENWEKAVEANRIKIGAKYAGGIIFFIDYTGKHGLVCAEQDFGFAVWGGEGKIGANGIGIANGSGIDNTKKIIELASWNIVKGFFSSNKMPISTAARICLESNYNGFNDWYLPTKEELIHIMKILKLDGMYWSSSEFTDGVIWTAEQQGGEMWRWFKDKIVYGQHAYAAMGNKVIINGRAVVCNVRGIRAF